MKASSATFLVFGLSLAACGSPDATESGETGTEGELPSAEVIPGIDKAHGYPACGDDPASQPSPCIDGEGAARCAVDTGYPGDEYALCDLDADEGMVLHFGPSDYDDPASLEPFILPPGGEQEFCMYMKTPNERDQFVDAYHGRMRPNSHHLIVTMPSEHEPSATPFECGPQIIDRWLFGSQDPQIDVQNGGSAQTSSPGDPDYGLAQIVPANQTLLLDFHNVNTTAEPELREAWASFHYIDADQVETTLDMLAFYQLDISIPPLAEGKTPRKTCVAPEDRYVGLVTGHAHQWMTRLTAWHEDGAGATNVIYQTTDWAEPGNALYRDGVENPSLPMDASQVWGAQSGYLFVKKGEAISFECEYMNTETRTIGLGDTAGDEMCNLFGMYYPTDGGTWNCF